MCIYTDRKPPQHKLISPAYVTYYFACVILQLQPYELHDSRGFFIFYRVAEALQSENLTLKKATIIIFKQLLEARGGELPLIEGVDWASEKVASGKSGRALNYIISQEARVDNRISNEEIANYDSDTQMLDSGSRTCPNSPTSRQSSPQSAAGDASGSVFWSAGSDVGGRQDQHIHALHGNRKAAKYGGVYPTTTTADINVTSVPTTMHVPAPSRAAFIDPNLLQPTGSIGSASRHPPTPPSTLDSLDYLPPAQMQWPGHHHQHHQHHHHHSQQQQQQHQQQHQQQQQGQQVEFYNERYLLPQSCFGEEMQQSPASEVACDSQAPWVAAPEFYQLYGGKE